MADQHKKIHPLNNTTQNDDVESSAADVRHNAPTAPLVPRGSSKSDHGDPAPASQLPPYPPPTYHGAKRPKRRRSTCCRCFCWIFSILLFLIIAVGATVGILFLIFRPKLPDVSIDRLQISQFSLTQTTPATLSATFDVAITARNPNRRIGIYYEGGSRIGVSFAGTELCRGAMPKFYQGHRNTTVLNVALSGESADAAALFGEMQSEQQRNGFVPLDLRVRQPVRIKLGKLKLPKIKFVVRCRLNVDSLTANNNIRIRNSSCKFRFRL
ncbi:NDR1/HIN1-like protein 6 [Linum grandiflorum]